jgi:hypothetical protein
MLYPWGYIPDQPIDWELFHHIRDDVNTNTSEIPIRNANQGLYPNSGTSRDYGYGIMGFPTFTFETDDEQWLLGTVEQLSSRLGEELDVMEYLISNVWYWRARLDVQSIEISDNQLMLDIQNHGYATTNNASLQYLDNNGDLLWASPFFSVNATNASVQTFDADGIEFSDEGMWNLNYQKRIIESSQWINETVTPKSMVLPEEDEGSFLIGYGIFHPLSIIVGFIAVANVLNQRPLEPQKKTENDEISS